MLMDVDEHGALVNRVAEEYSSSPDATEWKFKIRQGVEFHNGATLTAEDVVALANAVNALASTDPAAICVSCASTSPATPTS